MDPSPTIQAHPSTNQFNSFLTQSSSNVGSSDPSFIPTLTQNFNSFFQCCVNGVCEVHKQSSPPITTAPRRNTCTAAQWLKDMKEAEEMIR